ncbi:hypothetical protein APS67_005929 [Streptomyces sp. AVP053U2]|nr:hypothetical protein APS67_005929 [Streptomyces sp. AVP053U2]
MRAHVFFRRPPSEAGPELPTPGALSPGVVVLPADAARGPRGTGSVRA